MRDVIAPGFEGPVISQRVVCDFTETYEFTPTCEITPSVISLWRV